MKLKNIVLGGWCLMVGTCCATAFARGPQLVPDYDRDGDIGATDREKALAGQKFTIWLNDDDDDDGTDSGAEAGDTNNDLHDVPGGNDDKDFADDHVNGRCDLLDFFPVLIDVKEVVGWDGMTWKLSSESVNVVFTGLDEHKAGSFHTQEVKALDGSTPLYRAAVTNLTEDGVELPNGFLVNGRGVFLIEGAALADGGITLRGTKEGGDPVEVTMRLDVVNVEDMYGWMNLRPEAAVSSKPPYQPPAISRDSQRHFVLVHGYNTNHEEARGNAAEFYKKLWQSGSDAMFTAVEWKGNQSQVEIFGLNLTPNYHVNVENAFLAARPFAEACRKLTGEKILVGHSLGNMLISAAIKDYGLDYTKYVMLNAAVAREAYDASAYDVDMVDEDWLGDEVKDVGVDVGVGVDKLTNHLDRASRWYRNFADHKYDPYEYRRKLAWRGRFANLPRTVNYYSQSDNILVNPEPHEPDPDKIVDRNDPDIYNKVRALLAKKLVDGKSIGRGGTRKTGFGFWAFSEKLKGTWLLDVVNDVLTNSPLFKVAQADAYKREGGWGENDEYDDDPEKPFDPANTRFTPFLDERMKTKGMLDILPAETERLRAQHLADAIPAESFAAGANEVATVENVNEEDFIGENRDWPLYEGEEGEGSRTNVWNHSAFREVAFYHTSKFYASLAAVGKPRVIIDEDLGESKDGLFALDLAARMVAAHKLDVLAVMTNGTADVARYKELLDAASEKSVVICAIGTDRNLMTLLDEAPELVAAAVKELRVVDGAIVPQGWPTRVVVTGARPAFYESKDILADFPAGTLSPAIREAELDDPTGVPLAGPMAILPLTEGEPITNQSAAAILSRLRSIYRTGNPSVSVVPISPAEPGVDYNGSVLSVEFDGVNLGQYSIEDLRASLTIAGGVYEPDEDSIKYDELGGVLTFTITVPSDKVTAGNAYEGEVKVGFWNETLGENIVYTRKRPFVQGRQEQAEPMTDWFNETNLEAPTNYVPAMAMPERCLATVETTFLFEAPSEATDEPPATNAVQGAVRIVEDDAGGYKFQYYACVGKTNEDSFVRGWWDFNVGGEEVSEIKPKIGTNYTVRAEAYYFDDARGGENTLVISVDEEGSNRDLVKQFVGNVINRRGGQGGTTRLNSVEFLGDGEISSLIGNYYTNVVNATLAKIDGDREYATVAAAVAAAMGSPVRLMHAASWKPTTADIGRPVKFLNRSSLHLNLSELPLGTRAVWTDVAGNDGTLTLVAGLPVGVCSWTWHASMSNVLAQMAADGRYNGMQLALAPWLGIDSMSLYFGDQEGKEVWDFIKRKIASGELNVMATMINFPKEDYTTLTSITNTQGYMYGVAEKRSDADEQWASNLFYTAEAARLTKELGVKTLTTESGFICIDEDLMYDRVSNVCEVCQSYGVDFLIESGPQHSQYMTNLLTRLNAAGFKNVGVNFDPGDTALFGSEDPVESYRIMKPWIRMIHAKDCKTNRSAWNEDCVWGDGIVSGLDFGGSHTFLNAVKEDFANGVNILYERLSGDATLTVKRQGEIALAVDRILAALTEPEGSAGNPWAVGATGNVVLAYTNGTTLVVEGRGAMKDFSEAVAGGTAERSETAEGRDSTGRAPWGTGITDVDFGAQVTNFGANAFAGCAALTTLTMRGNPPALGGNDLSDVTIVVRKDALAKFKAADGWRDLTYGETMEVCYDYEHIKTLAPFLHEVWYDDYTFDAKGETLAGVESFSCSSVRNGNFIGRNFDFFLDDKPEFVVHVAADPAKGRLASVAMAMHTGMREDGVTNGQYTASYDLLPNRTLDGINECGVAINQNVVAYDPEVVAGPGKEFTGTNPGAPELNISFVTRMVLDQATNAAHAVELIKSRNLFGMSVSGDILHYMISDKDETYVVEIITNTVVARHFEMMTNFAINWDNENARALTDADTEWDMDHYLEPSNLVVSAVSFLDATNALAKYYARHAEGVERFVRLRDNYPQGATFEGMEALMRRAQYSQSSTFATQPYWYSDRCSVEVDKKLTEAGYPAAANIYMLYGLKYYKDVVDPTDILEGSLDDFLDKELMANERDCLEHKDDHRKDNCGVWLTVHNTTYDISNRMFRVAVQEDYDHTFDIYLSDRPVEQPVTPGEALGPYRTYEKATNVAEKAVLKPSAEVEEVLTTEEVRKDYKSKFDFAVAYKSGEESGWYVEAMLTAAGSNDLVRSANTVTTNINLAAIAALVGETTTSMTLMGGITGFYYSLHVGDAVTNIVPDANEMNLNVLCGKEEIGKVTFPEVKKPSDAAGFFTVGASAGRGGVIDTALPGGW